MDTKAPDGTSTHSEGTPRSGADGDSQHGPSSTPLEGLLVRTHEVIGREGARARALLVFCPSRERSVDLQTCARCPHLTSLPDAVDVPGACVRCTPPGGPALDNSIAAAPPSVAALAAQTTVGATMGSRVICVQPEVTVASVRDEFSRANAVFLPVVEASGRLLGVLWRNDLAPPKIREISALRDRLGAGSITTAAEQMDPRPIVLHEGSPLSDALRAMTVDRARTVAVVDADGAAMGLLSDLEVLMWFARQRRRLGF